MKRLRLALLVFLSVALVPAAMVTVFYGVENWRRGRAWDQAKRELAAAGESLDPPILIPPPIPDERNLAMIPLFARALDYRIDPATGRLTLAQRRWIYLGYQKILTGAMDAKARRVRPEQLKAIADERNAGNRVLSPTRFMMKVALPVMESVLIKTARTQAACEQAEVACALERHFLDRGS